MQAPAARPWWLRDGASDGARHAPLARDLDVDAAIVTRGSHELFEPADGLP